MTLYLVRYEGALPGGERWTTGFHISGAGDLPAALTAAGLGLGALWTGGGTAAPGIGLHYTPSVTASSYVVYELSAATLKATAKASADTTLAGTGTGSPLPQEVAVVATLRTAGVGPSARGRMYLPSPVVGDVLASGRLDSLAAGDMAASVAGCLGVVLGAGFTPVLASVGRADRPITSVEVGDVFDAQRRRRDKLVEVRESQEVVAL